MPKNFNPKGPLLNNVLDQWKVAHNDANFSWLGFMIYLFTEALSDKGMEYLTWKKMREEKNPENTYRLHKVENNFLKTPHFAGYH